MAGSNLTKFTAFRNEDEAIAMLESIRWPNGAACPHCGGADPYKLTPKATTTTRTQKGLWKCRACRKKFTAKVGTIFESSHIPVSKWLMAVHLLMASKKGMSAHQLHRMLGVTYRAAWFMAHRLRHAAAQDHGLFSGVVEMDETYVGGKRRNTRRGRPGPDSHKVPVVALVERGGKVTAFPVERVTSNTLKAALRKHATQDAQIMTDDFAAYQQATEGYRHDSVKHMAKEYVRGEVHTNTVEGFFSLLKRGINGTFHHVSKGHLHRYCDEFAFRYSNREAVGVTDEDRARLLVRSGEGKRLTFKQPSGTRAA
ncbi:MAG TPA: IS1595 family transposase [Nitrospirales bacterium]|nr:IS1595 family transposase [Nitrospirales bacterium]